METVLIVEVLDRAGRVKERVRVESFPFVIGRAYRCPLILDDRFVSPEHLQLVRDAEGTIWAEDLASTNGTFDATTNRRSSRIAIAPDTRLRAGNTLLRFRSTDYPVEPAALRDAAPRLLEPFVRNNLRCVTTFVVSVELQVTLYYLLSFERLHAGNLLLALAVFLGMLVGWAAVWALATRFLSPHFHFAPHLAIAAIALTAATAVSMVADLFAFAVAAKLSYEIFWWAGMSVVLAAILYAHLRFCSSAPARSVGAGALLSTAVVIGLCVLASVGFHWRTLGLSSDLEYSFQLEPPAFQLVRSRGVPEFFDRARYIRRRADELATEGGDPGPDGFADEELSASR